MATTKKAAAPKKAAAKRAAPKPTPKADVPAEALRETPDGYMWVTRKLPVQIGMVNPVYSEPALIDAKSLFELELQGYHAVDAPEADEPATETVDEPAADVPVDE